MLEQQLDPRAEYNRHEMTLLAGQGASGTKTVVIYPRVDRTDKLAFNAVKAKLKTTNIICGDNYWLGCDAASSADTTKTVTGQTLASELLSF
jgi:hypothetical protein